ncbi:MAG: ABC transporter ATP-binding protein [Chloroflexi bacterium]|nr:ABC transporter ATP-binding protein [Chloroflexota bacterium]
MHYRGGWRHGAMDAPARPLGLSFVQGYGRVLAYLRPYWRDTLLAVGAIVVISILGLLPPLVLKEIVDAAIPQKRGGYLNLLVAAMVGLPMASGLIGVAQSYLNNRVGQGVMRDLRTQLYSHLQRMEFGFFTQARSGEITSRLTNDVGGVQGVVSGTFPSVLTNVLTVLPTLALMLLMNWRLTLLSLALLPVFIYPTRRVGRLRRALSRESQERLADLSSQVQETLGVSGALLVRSFGQERAESERFRERSQQFMDVQLRQAVVGRWFFMWLGVISAAAPALVYWYGGHSVIGGTMTLGGILAFIAYQSRLFGPINSLLNIHVELSSALALFERIFEYLDRESAIVDRPGAEPLPRVQGRIAFHDVTFGYLPGRPVLHGVSFEVQPGQMAALVGPTGAGKTTVSYLVARLYDAESGSVEIDGHDVRDVTVDSLRGQIGVVTQDVFLLNDTLRNNLLYARPDATAEDLDAAVEAARLKELVASLPNGYDTLVGERGHRLSGGQKQMVAIARAILRDPRILILDEATSNLDTQNERLIREAVGYLLHERTSLVIAHRLSTVVSADVILVLDRGQLVEQGPHQELLARNGLYARMYAEGFPGVLAG